MSRAAKDLQWGRMRPAGRQFDMPGLKAKLSLDVHASIYFYASGEFDTITLKTKPWMIPW
jgi:hypothetical protein